MDMCSMYMVKGEILMAGTHPVFKKGWNRIPVAT